MQGKKIESIAEKIYMVDSDIPVPDTAHKY